MENKSLKNQFRKLTKKQKTCSYCGVEFSEGNTSSVDHIWPLVRYGKRANILENFIKVCRHCNSEKNGYQPTEWLKKKNYLTPALEDKIHNAFLAIIT